jgi:uncharacterized protein YndB with AHSA1/START domain
MATVNRETTVRASADKIWSLFEDANRWPEWLTPVRGLEENVAGSVREGSEFSARLGKVSGKIRVLEASRGRRLRWKAGPAMMLAMGMGMKGTLELQGNGNTTRVLLKHKTPMMMGPMMRMMSGLNPKEEMTKTVSRIKELSERSGG